MQKQFIQKSLKSQIISLKQAFVQTKHNIFGTIFSDKEIIENLMPPSKKYRDRIFTPIVTLKGFLFQALSCDHSCRNAVGQIIAELGPKKETCSSNTASYCTARSRLSLEGVLKLLKTTANRLHEKSLSLWLERSIKIVDGTTLLMQDTPKNQESYPQISNQKKGVGFPITRMVALISLNSGAVLDFAIGPYKGKLTGEHGLFRKIMMSLKKTTF